MTAKIRIHLAQRVMIWSVRLIAILTIAAGVASQIGLERSRLITSDDIINRQGYMSVVSLGSRQYFFLETRGDTNANPQQASTRLFEDDRSLGPSHSLHADISARGEGRYSHYRQHLYFSASDNSDPRTNGRSYRVEYEVYLASWLIGLLVFLSTLGIAAGVEPADPAGSLRRRIETLTFGLSLSVLGVLICFAATVALAVGLAIPEVRWLLFDFVRDKTKLLTIFGYAVAAGAVATGLGRGGTAATAHTLLAAVGLLLLAIGLDQRILSTVQLTGLLTGIVVATAVRVQWRPAQTAADAIAWWRAADAQGVWLARWVILGAMLLGLFQVLPEVVRYWDELGWMDSYTYDRLAHEIATGASPWASNGFMPLYQYGLAAFYWAFGHFFFVQQIVNVLLAMLTVGFTATAAYLLFGRAHITLLVGVVAAMWPQFHHAPWMTQIEGWYLPIFAGSLLALAVYLTRPGWRTIALVALAAALVFNTRLQGAFYSLALGFAVLFVQGLSWRDRVRQVLVFAIVFLAVGILPWSLRNWYVEGSFSPSSNQSSSFLAVLNDPRVPLYGIRYWEVPKEVSTEWNERYPNVKDRLEAQRRYFWERLFDNPGYFAAAAPWRLLAFYGLLPPGALTPDGPRPTDWRTEGKYYIFSTAQSWSLMLLSVLGWLARPRSRYNILLAGLIGANVLVGLSVGSAEPRLCYPVLLIHLLMGASVFAPFAAKQSAVREQPIYRDPLPWGQLLAGSAVVLVLVLIYAHFAVGRRFMFRPLMNQAWRYVPEVNIDATLPLIVAHGRDLRLAASDARIEPGATYRIRFRVTPYLLPPRSVCCWSDFDKQIQKDESVRYFYADVYDDRGSLATGSMGVRYEGASVMQKLAEGDVVEAIIRIDAAQDQVSFLPRFWGRIEAGAVLKVGTPQ